ncbi:MAG: cytochrome c3 family protein [Thermodesulfobacteriota bacterium]
MKRSNRRRKRTALGACFLALFFVFTGSRVMAQEELELKMSGELTRPPVVFPHDLHMSTYDCFDCHHDYDSEGNNVLEDYALEEGNPDIRCTACHTSKSDIEPREAFHGQCMGCHERFTFRKRPTGPVLCGECHIKQSIQNTENEEE